MLTFEELIRFIENPQSTEADGRIVLLNQYHLPDSLSQLVRLRNALKNNVWVTELVDDGRDILSIARWIHEGAGTQFSRVYDAARAELKEGKLMPGQRPSPVAIPQPVALAQSAKPVFAVPPTDQEKARHREQYALLIGKLKFISADIEKYLGRNRELSALVDANEIPYQYYMALETHFTGSGIKPKDFPAQEAIAYTRSREHSPEELREYYLKNPPAVHSVIKLKDCLRIFQQHVFPMLDHELQRGILINGKMYQGKFNENGFSFAQHFWRFMLLMGEITGELGSAYTELIALFSEPGLLGHMKRYLLLKLSDSYPEKPFSASTETLSFTTEGRVLHVQQQVALYFEETKIAVATVNYGFNNARGQRIDGTGVVVEKVKIDSCYDVNHLQPGENREQAQTFQDYVDLLISPSLCRVTDQVPITISPKIKDMTDLDFSWKLASLLLDAAPVIYRPIKEFEQAVSHRFDKELDTEIYEMLRLYLFVILTGPSSTEGSIAHAAAFLKINVFPYYRLSLVEWDKGDMLTLMPLDGGLYRYKITREGIGQHASKRCVVIDAEGQIISVVIPSALRQSIVTPAIPGDCVSDPMEAFLFCQSSQLVSPMLKVDAEEERENFMLWRAAFAKTDAQLLSMMRNSKSKKVRKMAIKLFLSFRALLTPSLLNGLMIMLRTTQHVQVTREIGPYLMNNALGVVPKPAILGLRELDFLPSKHAKSVDTLNILDMMAGRFDPATVMTMLKGIFNGQWVVYLPFVARVVKQNPREMRAYLKKQNYKAENQFLYSVVQLILGDKLDHTDFFLQLAQHTTATSWAKWLTKNSLRGTRLCDFLLDRLVATDQAPQSVVNVMHFPNNFYQAYMMLHLGGQVAEWLLAYREALNTPGSSLSMTGSYYFMQCYLRYLCRGLSGDQNFGARVEDAITVLARDSQIYTILYFFKETTELSAEESALIEKAFLSKLEVAEVDGEYFSRLLNSFRGRSVVISTMLKVVLENRLQCKISSGLLHIISLQLAIKNNLIQTIDFLIRRPDQLKTLIVEMAYYITNHPDAFEQLHEFFLILNKLHLESSLEKILRQISSKGDAKAKCFVLAHYARLRYQEGVAFSDGFVSDCEKALQPTAMGWQVNVRAVATLVNVMGNASEVSAQLQNDLAKAARLSGSSIRSKLLFLASSARDASVLKRLLKQVLVSTVLPATLEDVLFVLKMPGCKDVVNFEVVDQLRKKGLDLESSEAVQLFALELMRHWNVENISWAMGVGSRAGLESRVVRERLSIRADRDSVVSMDSLLPGAPGIRDVSAQQLLSYGGVLWERGGAGAAGPSDGVVERAAL